MSQMLPPGLADVLQQGPGTTTGGYGPVPDLGQAGIAPETPDPLQTLQDVIQSMPGLMAALPDPQDVQNVAKALLILTGVQTRLMGNGSGSTGP